MKRFYKAVYKNNFNFFLNGKKYLIPEKYIKYILNNFQIYLFLYFGVGLFNYSCKKKLLAMALKWKKLILMSKSEVASKVGDNPIKLYFCHTHAVLCLFKYIILIIEFTSCPSSIPKKNIFCDKE